MVAGANSVFYGDTCSQRQMPIVAKTMNCFVAIGRPTRAKVSASE
jgi:hypothetical protein